MLRTTWLCLLLMALPAPGAGQAKPAEDPHSTSIHGLRIGMTAQEVLEGLGRMPDERKDESDEIIVFWKLKSGDILQVRFRNETHVSFLGLQYRPPRPINDFMLRPMTRDDPRYRRDYRATETTDQRRSVWNRREVTEGGYRIEISFLSAERQRMSHRFDSEVEFKYVSLVRGDLKKFDQAMK